MTQIVHIFRKDIRHHWPEVGVSLGLLAAFVWAEPSVWYRPGPVGFVFPGLMAGRISATLLGLLVPVAWCFLVVRVVQGEPLVGDRQFWITRPYEWPKLLAAKVLLILVFITVPLFIAQLYLLARAGFPPAPRAAHLLWGQVLLAALMLLPIGALGSVTSSVSQVVLAVLAILLYLVGLGSLAALTAVASWSLGSVAGSLILAVYIGVAAAVVLWQYARRRTAWTRGLLIIAAIAIAVIIVAASRQTGLSSQYQQPSAGRPLPVQFSLEAEAAPRPKAIISGLGKVLVWIPLNTSGMSPDLVVKIDDTQATLDGQDGLRWRSDWEPSNSFLIPEQKRTQIYFMVKKDIFARFRMNPVNLRVEFALTTYREMPITRMTVPEGEFEMQDVGICSVSPANPQTIYCRAPRWGSHLVLVSSPYSASTCSAPAGQPSPPGKTAYGLILGREREFWISPVTHFEVNLAMWEDDSSKSPYPGVCPGTPLTFATLQAAGHFRSEIEFNHFRLPPVGRAKLQGTIRR